MRETFHYEGDMTKEVTISNRTIEAFWSIFPPLWHQIRAFIREEANHHFDITVNQFHMLRRIDSGKDSVSKLADDKHISRAAISRIVEVLVNKNLITRTHNPEDRRQVKLTLTVEGRTLLDTLFQHTRRWMDSKLVLLDDHELENIIQALNALKKAFEAEG